MSISKLIRHIFHSASRGPVSDIENFKMFLKLMPQSMVYGVCSMLNEAIDKVYITGKSINFQYKILNDHFEVTVSKMPYNMILSEIREITDIEREVSCIDDITEKSATIQKAKKSEQETLAANQLFLAILNNMSIPLVIKDANNDYRYIIVNKEYCNNLGLEDDDIIGETEFWNIINTNSDLLLRLINDILELSKIEAGTIELKPMVFDIVEHFNSIYYALNHCNVNPNIKFICNNPYPLCMVKLDSNIFTQIITNFVTNAFKFTTSGEVTMGYEYVDGGIKLYCEDTGTGIAANKIDKVFLCFNKLNSFAQGAGLGLAICKAIIDGCNGNIGVESIVGERSKLWA